MFGARSSKPWMGVLLLGVLGGVAYPWPWVRAAEATVEKTAQVQRLAGPAGCMCLALTVDTILAPKSVYGGHAEAFCAPETDERMLRWIASGSVSAQWRLTFQTTGFSDTTLQTTTLISVEAVSAADLLANNGCTMVLP